MRSVALGTDCELKLTREGKTVVDEAGARVLRALFNEGSVEKASRSLKLSRTALVRSIRAMEAASGTRLSEGGRGRPLRLNRDGERLLLDYESRRMAAREQLEHRFRNPVLAVDAIIVLDGKLVVVTRGNPPFKGKHALPGGFVEYGESLEQAVMREAKEETGLKTEIIGLLGTYSDPERDPRGHTVSVVYVLKTVGGRLRSGDDAAGVELIDLDAVPSLAFDHSAVVNDFLRSAFRERATRTV
ncbi:MAG TPA: NUDIX domain-containing protein [Methanomassiliicoccales archaeon]|nr:NUDIX domain-containing protein [Methanomassiliicoccales archaeon]